MYTIAISRTLQYIKVFLNVMDTLFIVKHEEMNFVWNNKN